MGPRLLGPITAIAVRLIFTWMRKASVCVCARVGRGQVGFSEAAEWAQYWQAVGS